MNIGEWSFEPPTEEGLYFCNLGDVVTDMSLTTHNIIEINGDFYDRIDFGVDRDKANPIDLWNSSNKWMKIDTKYLNGL